MTMTGEEMRMKTFDGRRERSLSKELFGNGEGEGGEDFMTQRI